MRIRISAIICTHNRSAYLKRAIQSLVDQTLPKEQYEIIVVDNGSTDDTKAIVEGFYRLENLRYIYEPILGLSQARNTGWQNARGKYVAYLDDDAVAYSEWLERIVAAFETVNPRPGSVGGKVVPIWEAERPAWLTKRMEIDLTIINWADEPIVLTEKYQFLAGTNVAYPREILEAFDGFSTSLGRKGNSLISGEEMLLRNYLSRHNLPTYYDPRICVQHHIQTERLSYRWFYRRYFDGGITDVYIDYIESSRRKANWHYLWEALLNVLHAIRYPTILASIILPANSGPWVTRRCYLYLLLGRLRAQLRIGFGQVGSELKNH